MEEIIILILHITINAKHFKVLQEIFTTQRHEQKIENKCYVPVTVKISFWHFSWVWKFFLHLSSWNFFLSLVCYKRVWSKCLFFCSYFFMWFFPLKASNWKTNIDGMFVFWFWSFEDFSFWPIKLTDPQEFVFQSKIWIR